MCAIMGVLEKSNPVELEVLQDMQKILKHRGPDDTGLQRFQMPYLDKGL